MTTKIFINRGNIDRNRSDVGANHAVVEVEYGNRTVLGHGAVIHGPSRIIYKKDNPIVKVWLETEAQVDVIQ